MGFVFSLDQTIGEECRRILVEECSGAIELLSSFVADPDLTIHEVRKHNKRIRSIIKLVSPVFGKESTSTANDRVRESARYFSDARDAFVMMETREDLTDRYSTDGSEIHESLREKHSDRIRDPEIPGLLAKAAEGFEKARAQIGSWPWDDVTEEAILDSINSNYRRGIKDMETARVSRDPDEFHDWRKRAKYLSYHLMLLSGLVDKPLDSRCEKATALASLLGAHHDLEVFREHLHEGTVTHSDAQMSKLAKRRQLEIEEEAFQLGDIVYSDKPRKFRKRFEKAGIITSR